jgi:hypothetical protein
MSVKSKSGLRAIRHQCSNADTAEAPALQHGSLLKRHHLREIFSAPRLNNRSFALANWRLAFADATRKPKGENYRTHRNQQFSHGESPRTKCMNWYRQHSCFYG